MAIVKESRQVQDFEEVAMEGHGDLVIVQGDAETLEIEADEEILPKLKTEVRGRRLVLGYRNWWDWLTPPWGGPPIHYTVTMKTVRRRGDLRLGHGDGRRDSHRRPPPGDERFRPRDDRPAGCRNTGHARSPAPGGWRWEAAKSGAGDHDQRVGQPARRGADQRRGGRAHQRVGQHPAARGKDPQRPHLRQRRRQISRPAGHLPADFRQRIDRPT